MKLKIISNSSDELARKTDIDFEKDLNGSTTDELVYLQLVLYFHKLKNNVKVINSLEKVELFSNHSMLSHQQRYLKEYFWGSALKEMGKSEEAKAHFQKGSEIYKKMNYLQRILPNNLTYYIKMRQAS